MKMLKFTLMKSLYYMLDPEGMDGIREIRQHDRRFRTVDVSYPQVEDVTSFTMEERFLPYSRLYFIFLNEDRYPSDMEDIRVKKVILAFLQDHYPECVAEDIPEKLDHVDILDYLDPDRMPGYPSEHAYSDLLTLSDLRAGKTGDEFKSKASFPNMTFARKYRK